MADDLEYFIESIGDGKSFNLWVKQGVRYFNRATLFFQDGLCRNQWNVSDLEHSVSYDENEITDEIESPLKRILGSTGNALLQMQRASPEIVFEYLIQHIKFRKGLRE